MDDDPTTEELRIGQSRREAAERERAAEADAEDATEQHERRAEKADYLKSKLEERKRAEAERGS
jgi:hypothetical protein